MLHKLLFVLFIAALVAFEPKRLLQYKLYFIKLKMYLNAKTAHGQFPSV